MKKKWFMRQLISYIPIFLLLATFLTLITLLTIGEMSKKASWELNQAATGQMLQIVERSLQDIDKMVIKEIAGNSSLVRFFHGKGDVMEESKVSEMLQNWMVNNPLIHSVYLYRRSDNIVLNQSFRTNLEEIADVDFLYEQANAADRGFATWSDPRTYRETALQERTEQVISMVKDFPFPSGKFGIIVVNVKLSDIDLLIQPITASRTNFIRLYDSSGKAFGGPLESENQILTEIHSDYTNWTIRSGLLYSNAMDFSRTYIVLSALTGFLAMLAGTLWVIYIAHKNYKPIGLIMNQLLALRRLDVNKKSGKNSHELDMIGSVLDQLIRQAVDHEKVHEENLFYRRRVFFHDLLKGQRTVGDEEWRREASLLGIPLTCKAYQTALVEIDKFNDFTVKYSTRDQNLLKFALGNIIKEMLPEGKGFIWTEWLEDRKLGMLFLLEGEDENFSLRTVCEQVCESTKMYLKFTVTIGVGNSYVQPEFIPRSLWQAERALDEKLVSGNNHVFQYQSMNESQSKRSMNDYFHSIEKLARIYRMEESGWEHHYEELFANFKSAALTHEEFSTLVHLLITSFQQEALELPTEYQELWTNVTETPLKQIANKFENIEELQNHFRSMLEQFEQQMKVLRESRQYAAIAQQVREHIDQYYNNPDLSLAHLGDLFEINPKYLSYIFKEQFGIKFVDYLASVRLNHAKTLLLSSNDTIPNIAARVGYLHAVSFNRVFKKIVGKTPGEYRNETEAYN